MFFDLSVFDFAVYATALKKKWVRLTRLLRGKTRSTYPKFDLSEFKLSVVKFVKQKTALARIFCFVRISIFDLSVFNLAYGTYRDYGKQKKCVFRICFFSVTISLQHLLISLCDFCQVRAKHRKWRRHIFSAKCHLFFLWPHQSHKANGLLLLKFCSCSIDFQIWMQQVHVAVFLINLDLGEASKMYQVHFMWKDSHCTANENRTFHYTINLIFYLLLFAS